MSKVEVDFTKPVKVINSNGFEVPNIEVRYLTFDDLTNKLVIAYREYGYEWNISYIYQDGSFDSTDYKIVNLLEPVWVNVYINELTNEITTGEITYSDESTAKLGRVASTGNGKYLATVRIDLK